MEGEWHFNAISNDNNMLADRNYAYKEPDTTGFDYGVDNVFLLIRIGIFEYRVGGYFQSLNILSDFGNHLNILYMKYFVFCLR